MSKSQPIKSVESTAILSENERHTLLASEQRRQAIAVLSFADAPVDLDDLTHAVATRGEQSDDEESIERIKITLHHIHLPKMEDFGVLEYDTEGNVVESHVFNSE